MRSSAGFAAATEQSPTLTRAQFWTGFAGVLLAMMLAALDQSIVNTALPRIVRDLGGVAHLSWVVTSFMLTSTVSAPLYGKLSDIHGRRRMFIVAILLFLAGSLLSGAARSMIGLIGFRALQGLGAGGLLVLAQSAIGDLVTPIERPRYQGLFTGTFAIASVAGPVLGGLITEALSWRWVFYVNLPIGVLALLMIVNGLRNPPNRERRPVDYAGTLLLAGATTSLLLLLAWGGSQISWISGQAAGLVLATMLLGVLFLLREAHAAEPLIRLALFRNPVFTRVVATATLVSFAMFGAVVFLPLYFQTVLGMRPALAGTMMLPQVAGMLASSVIGGAIVSRLGRSKSFLLAGIGLLAGSMLSLAALAALHAAASLFLISMATLGIGIGMAMPNLTNSTQNAVARTELGAATGAMVFLRSLGGAAGVAASGAILSTRLTGGAGLAASAQAAAEATRAGLIGSFLLCGIVMAGALVLISGLKEISLRGSAR